MNTGIIVFSNTGNTLSVVKELRELIQRKGHSVELKEISVVGGHHPNKQSLNRKFEFDEVFSLDQYDAVVFASFVEAFGLCPPMKAYMNRVGPLAGKKLAVLITQHFPYSWMGGNHAVNQLKKLCGRKGGIVSAAGVVNWGSEKRRAVTRDRAVRTVSGIF